MKINWGTGIAITLAIFVGAMAFLIWISYQQRLNLVSEDYYPQGINYQEHIQKERNASALAENVSIEVVGENIQIKFPKTIVSETIKGTITAFRPSDNRLDKQYKINIDTNYIQNIPFSDLIRGLYTIKVDWQSDSTKYYFESNLNL